MAEQALWIPAFVLKRLDQTRLNTPSLEIPHGSILAITGPSGAGKSLFLKSLFGWAATKQEPVLCPKSGSFLMTQDPSRGLTPGYAVSGHFRDVGVDQAVATPVLRALDLDPKEVWARKPEELSGGQKQRLMLAMILVQRPQVLVCDEPAASLDPENETRLWDLILGLEHRPQTLIFVTHRLELIVQHADRVLLLDEGEAIFWGEKDDFFDQPVHATHRDLIRSYHHAQEAEPDMDTAAEVLLSGSGLGVRFGRTVVFEGLNLQLQKGRLYWLSGPSGSGKTSLARLLAGLLPASVGELKLEADVLPLALSHRSKWLRRSVQYVFQHGALALNPALKVGSQLRRLWAHDPDGLSQTLAQLGLTDVELGRKPRYYSVGQLQRLNLAAVIAVDPLLLICDEILEPLDMTLTHRVLDFLEARCRAGKTVVLISHDPALPKTRTGVHLRLGEMRDSKSGNPSLVY